MDLFRLLFSFGNKDMATCSRGVLSGTPFALTLALKTSALTHFQQLVQPTSVDQVQCVINFSTETDQH